MGVITVVIKWLANNFQHDRSQLSSRTNRLSYKTRSLELLITVAKRR